MNTMGGQLEDKNMDRKFVDFRMILFSLLIAALIAVLLSSRFLAYGGWDSAALNHVVAGAIIGAPVFMVTWLVMMLIRAAARQRNK
jgi:hypothetical protein